jgi:tetratricopeptide (TPR) repeat protein
MPLPSAPKPGPRLAGWLAGLLFVVVGVAANLVSDQLPAAWGNWINAHPIPTAVGFVLLAVAAVALGERSQRREHPQALTAPAGTAGTQTLAGRDVHQSEPRAEVRGGSGGTATSIAAVYGNVTIAPPSIPTESGSLAATPVGCKAEQVSGRVSNLPPPNPHFTGRQDVLDQLHEHLTSSGRLAVVAAHGLGGVGKTQLVLAYAHQHADTYPLVWWVPAETDVSAAAALAALAPFLGMTVKPDQEATVTAVLQALGQRRAPDGGPGWLLVFDNAEAPQRLRRLLPPGGAGRVLVTSRNPAWGGLARRLQVDVLSEAEAVALLLGQTGSTDRAAAVALARELDRLPLALAQVAGYCEQTGLSLAEYLDAFRRRRDQLLASGQPVGYPATVAMTWQLSVDKLAGQSPAALQLLRLAAFLAPEAIPLGLLTVDPRVLPDELAAAAADEGALDAAVGALVGLSLVARERGGLRLHRLVQAATRANLPAEQANQWATRAVLLVRAAFPRPVHDPRGWPQAAGLLAHALAAADHAEDRQAAPKATGALRNEIGIYLGSRAELAAAREQLERALRLKEAAHGPDDPELATTLINLGNVLHQLGEPAAAREHLERALRLLEAAHGPDHPDVARTLNNLGVVLGVLGDLRAERAHLERALRLREAAYGPDHPQLASTLTNLGNVLGGLGEPVAAREQLERALRLLESAYGPDHPEAAGTLDNLSVILRLLGEPAAAREQLERALRLKEEAYGPDHPEVAKTLTALGIVLRDLEELAAAREQMERAARIFRHTHGAEHRDTRWVQSLLDELP